MQRYEKLLPVLDRIIADTTALLDGEYGPLDTEEPDLVEDTETIRDSASELYAHIKTLNDSSLEHISGMAHDMRGTINGILGWAEIIVQGLDGDLTDEQQPIYERVMADGLFTLLEVDTLIDHARLQIGTLRMQAEPTDLNDLLSDTIQLYSNQPAISVVLDIPDDLPTIQMDSHRLKQTLYHLAHNAQHHGHAQTIQVWARQEGDTVTIIVQDDGDGIKADDMAHVTDAFYQADGARGVGLGLALAKGLTETYNGTLTLTSDSDGTQVKLCFPLTGD
jgi:signal transduction histidine kinase